MSDVISSICLDMLTATSKTEKMDDDYKLEEQ